MSKAIVDTTQATGNHNRLVIAPTDVAGSLLVAAEIAQQIRAAELIVECGAAQGAFNHDVQRTGNALGPAMGVLLPGLGCVVEVQMRNGKPGQARLGLGTAACGPFIANFASCAGCRAGEWRYRRGMIVRFDLHQRVYLRRMMAVYRCPVRRRGIEGCGLATFHNGGVIGIRHDRAGRLGCMRSTNHAEQRVALRFAVNDPLGIEYFMAAMFTVCLGKHH